MLLFTQDQFDRLCRNGRPESHGHDWYPVVKLMLPGTARAWLINEIFNHDYQLYGYGISDDGMGGLSDGYIDLAALELMNGPMQADYVRQDPDFIPRHGISVYHTAARMCGSITDDPDVLRQAVDYLEVQEHKIGRWAIVPRIVLQP